MDPRGGWGALFAIAIAVALGMGAAAPALAEERLLENAAFAEWRDGAPLAWTLSVGATGGGEGPESAVLRGAEGGLALEGDASTKRWRLVAQAFPAAAKRSYRLRFTARAIGVRREAGQFNGCYAGLAFFDAQGKRLAVQVADVVAPAWSPGEVAATAPEGAARAEVRIFLAKTGRLEVRAVELEELRPEQSFAILVADMDRHYSYFAHRGVDWPALAEKYRARAEAARDASAFVSVAREMLAELGDHHVWIRPPDGRLVPTYAAEPADNFDLRAVAKKLAGARQIGKVGLAGKTAEGFGYACVGTLAGEDAPFAELESAIEALLDAPGFLLDLRANVGGDETRARRLAAFFADARRVYGRSKVRSGPAHTDLAEGPERTLAPRAGRTFTRPVVCLVGPRCMSSGEAFVQMMRALPHVTLVGQPTRGSSGNPAPVALPNGVTVWYSRWVDMLPDGTVVEGRGIAPDVAVAHAGPGDPTFAAAVRELARRVAEAGRARPPEGGAK